MKKLIYLITSIFLYHLSYSQILIDDKSGDVIGNNIPQIGGGKNISLIRLNTGSQSIGFSHFLSSSMVDASNYSVNEFSLKTRPTDGLGPLINNGQFAPGIKLGYTYTKVNLFSDTGPGGYIDWGGVSINYDIDKYTLIKKDTTYFNQLYNKNFNGLGLYAYYSGLIKSKWIVYGRIGYTHQNNLDELSSVEAKEIIFTSTDPISGQQREVVKSKIGKLGLYEEFDGFPIILSITRTTKSDDPKSPDFKESLAAARLRIGFTAYLKNVMSNRLPNTTIGVILFLAKQDKMGVRIPILGLSIQAKDPFDVLNKGNSFQNRLGIGFTSVFSL
ncbi:hypothetical protein [Siphonobacter sp. SORGH_AS_0500]|uniref:hypothetical protein n=1 Tax=Siphonobacter sp. SORGH_AS_0500 TaxID=1864824 RepID=UPI0012FF0335|nr:hypothetical protein [Siphonobacter sp. SORGH_AS_0500]